MQAARGLWGIVAIFAGWRRWRILIDLAAVDVADWCAVLARRPCYMGGMMAGRFPDGRLDGLI